MSSIGQGSISIDDSTRIGQNAQDTANEVAGNVSDINSDNKLTPSEKLKLKQEYDKDVELYNIDIEQLKSVDLPTAELDSALSNLTNFVTPLFKEMNRTSTVDRNALDSVFTAFATADKNSSQAFVNMVQQVADGAKKAGDDAKEAGEKAQEAGEEAKASADQAKADATATQQALNNIHLGVKNADGSTATFNMNSNTILLDANKIIFNGKTSILDASIDTTKIANAAINTVQIADGAINNAKIANASIDDAKINSLNGNKLVENSITAKKINVEDLIANGINTKTLTSVNLNTSTLTTPQLDLGLNGTLTTDFDIGQPTSFYAPKKGTGTLTIKTGVINTNSQNMSRYSNTEGYWYGFDDNSNMIKNGTNQTSDDYAPGYEKHDIMKSTGAVLNRSYLDAMGLMFTEGGTTTYNTMLTGAGLETATALLHKDLATNGTFEAALGTKNTYGFSIGSNVVAPMIRAKSYTYAANMFISSYGTMGLATSTKANKLDIVDVPDMLQKGYNLLTINPRQWFDKTSVEAYADVQSGNSDSIESVVNIKPVTGMVAEEVASAGLDDYVVKDENNKVQGLAYDRLWTLLLPVLRDMNDKINKLQKKEGI